MQKKTSIPVITIDGPSGVGKGTLGKRLASRLGWHYLESGAIYRILAIAASQKNVPQNDEQALTQLAHTLQIDFEIEEDTIQRITMNGNDVSHLIRKEDISQIASEISAFPKVRQALLALQRDFRKPPGLVTDGRDMGTVIFPDANLKIFLSATVEERAKRRYKQLQESGFHDKFDAVVRDLQIRDERDQKRQAAPLKPADDAVLIDTTQKSIDVVFDEVLILVRQRGLLETTQGGSATNP